MSIRTREDYHFGKKAASGVVVFVLFVAALMFFAGSTVIGRTETIADTTIVSVHNSTVTDTYTQTAVQYITVTATNYTTVYYIGPDSVEVSGRVSTTGLGTSPTQVVFQNEMNQTLIAQVTNGAYTISLPNHHFYSTFIRFTTSAAGVGSGQCTSAALVLFFTGSSITASFRC